MRGRGERGVERDRRGGEGESKMIQNAMQVAADDDQPNAAPFIKRRPQKKKNK